MTPVDRLAERLGGELGALLMREQAQATELRLRSGQASRLCRMDGSEIAGPVLDAASMQSIVARL